MFYKMLNVVLWIAEVALLIFTGLLCCAIGMPFCIYIFLKMNLTGPVQITFLVSGCLIVIGTAFLLPLALTENKSSNVN